MGATLRRARLPHGFLGMLALVLGCELAIARQGISLLNVQPAMFRFAARAAEREAPHCDILCLGDSLVKLGLVPRLLEAELGRSTYNLALIAGQPPSSYFLLRRALEAGARPSAVVVNFKANCLSYPPWVNVRQWCEIGGLRDCLELAWAAPDAHVSGTILTDWLLPSFQSRDQLRSWILAALAGQSGASYSETVPYWHNWSANQGAQIMPKNPVGRTDPKLLEKSIYYPDQWWCDPVNARYLQRFLKLARTHNIPVFWLLAPIQPCVQAKREQNGLDERYMKLVQRALAKFPNLFIIDGRHSGYEPDVFIDFSHLDRDGAAALSAGVASVLRDHFTRGSDRESRMVALPAYEAPRTGSELEDLAQSRLALGNRK